MVSKNYDINKRSSIKSKQLLAVENTTNTIAEETFIPFLFTRTILAVVGVLPCEFESPYWPSFDLRRSSCVYGCFIYSLFTCNFVLSAMHKKEDHDRLDPEDSVGRMICTECFFLTLPHAIGAVILYDNRAFKNTFRAYTELQIKYKKATGRCLENRRRHLERFTNSLGVIGPPIVYVSVLYAAPQLRQEHFVGACLIYANTIGLMVLVFWLNVSFSMLDVANDAKAEFSLVLTKEDLNYSMVYDFRLLWLSMRAVLKSLACWQSAMTEYYVYMSLLILFSFEGAMTWKSGDTAIAFAHCFGCVVFTIAFSIVFMASHWVQDKMKFMVSDLLATVPLANFDTQVQREVLMLFVVEGAQPAVTVVGGLLVMNKHLTLSLIASVTSYIIVLVQMVAPDEDLKL